MSLMDCPRCDGKGYVALHGIAITADEWNDWDPDEQDAYLSGGYDTECEWCDGEGAVDEDEYYSRVESERLYRMETGYLP